MKRNKAVTAHAESLLREYRSRSIDALRALPPSQTLPEFRDQGRTWTVYLDSTNLDDGGGTFALFASRECFWGRWTWADGFVMDAKGQARDLTREESWNLT